MYAITAKRLIKKTRANVFFRERRKHNPYPISSGTDNDKAQANIVIANLMKPSLKLHLMIGMVSATGMNALIPHNARQLAHNPTSAKRA